MDENINKALTDCLSQIEVDYLPLHDIYRAIYGFHKETPTAMEFNKTLELVNHMLSENDIVCLEGPKMQPTNKPIPELLAFLRTKWENQEYDEINYGFWFDKKEN